MNILLVGGNKNISFLAKSLKANGHAVMVINQDYDWCQTIADNYEIECVCGDGSDPRILETAHAEKMDIVIGLYDQDSTNLIVCDLAKNQFHVKNTFTIVNDPKNAELFQSFGVDKCVSTTRIFGEWIEQQSLDESIRKHLPDNDSRVVIRDVVLSKNAPSIGKKLWEIGFPPNSIVTCILREEEIIIPQGNTILLSGDKVVVISSAQSFDTMIVLLNGKK